MKKLYGVAHHNGNRFLDMAGAVNKTPKNTASKQVAKAARLKLGTDVRVVLGPDHIHYNGHVK